jgi:hypothetical protein
MLLTPEIDERRAAFVLGKINDILSWEKTKEHERDALRRTGGILVRGAG